MIKMHDESLAPCNRTSVLFFGVIINSVSIFQDVRNKNQTFLLLIIMRRNSV